MEKEINIESKIVRVNFYLEGDQDLSDDLAPLLQECLDILSNKNEDLFKAKFKSVEVNLNLVNDGRIKELNQEYRNKNKPTDVLSFPLQENVRRGEYDVFEGHIELGDIFVAEGVCGRQALENEITFDQEFIHLFIHGFLHLCGYDHEESEQEDALMRQLESDILDEFGGR